MQLRYITKQVPDHGTWLTKGVWSNDGKIAHREDGPAYVNPSGEQFFYLGHIRIMVIK